MKIFRTIMGTVCCLLALASCDTRDELYTEDIRNGQCIIEINGHRDTVPGYYSKAKDGVVYDLYPRTLYARSGDFVYDTVHVKLYALIRGKEYPLEFSGPNFNPSDVTGNINLKRGYTITDAVSGLVGIGNFRNMVLYTQIKMSDQVSVFHSDTSSALLGGYLQEFRHYGLSGERTLEDEEFMVYLNFRLWGPCPPTSVLDVVDVEGNPYEKRISMSRSHDKDGKVVKYEYCIDGNVRTYGPRDNRFDFFEGPWQSGQSAYGGDYITATEISEINYEFQTKGAHKIYYRCMDDMFIWSTWKCETIIIQ